MKARTRKSRWLLIALLFGFLAAVGLTLARHHGAPTVAMAHGVTTPHAVTPQPPLPLSASIGGEHTFAAPAGGRPDDVTPNSTSSVPAYRLSSNAQAACAIVFGVNACVRAKSCMRAINSAGR